MINHLLGVILLLTSFSALASAGISTPPNQDELAQSIEAIIDRQELGRFWGAIVVRVGDTTILSRGYGFENSELHSIEPNTSLFDVGSVSKSITAATILKLIEQNKLQLSTTLAEVFADASNNLADVTIEQLLRHESGLANGNSALSYANALESIDTLINTLGESTLGPNDFAYSNEGYFLLAAIIERVGEGSFEEVVRRLVFEPAQLNGIGFVGDAQIPGYRPTTRIRRGRYGIISQSSLFEYPWNWGQRGATGVVMTAQTAADWFEAIESGDWITDQSRNAMLTPNNSGYGFGLYVDINDNNQITRFWHGGSTAGYLCHAARYPLAFDGQGATVILMSQSDSNLQSIARQIHQLIEPPKSMPTFAGIYLNGLDKYEHDSIYTIDQGLRWKGQTQYIGSDGTKRIVDERPTLILQNQDPAMWTLIIRMDQHQAQSLIEELTNATNQIANDPVGGSTPWSRGTTLIVNVKDMALTQYNSYIIDEGAQISVQSTPDYFVQLTISTPDGEHELAKVLMGGAQVRQLQAQLKSAMR